MVYKKMMKLLIILLGIFLPINGLENGLALTPPMGWMAWERFRCEIDCKQYPNECISEKLFMDMADRMAEDGYKEAGYEYIIIDDCWLARERDENGRLQPDPERFPSGIKALADYVHGKGLKFGIYEDYGTYTCAGYPGIIDNLELDAKTIAEWDVDYLKLDGCYAELENISDGYAKFSKILNETGRPIVFSCSYPAYEEDQDIQSDYQKLADNCNLWRNYGDIGDTFNDVTDILNFYTENQDRFGPFAGPGHWNDPDMLIIGNFGLSIDQSKAQMALWAILAAPLIMSNDLRHIRPEFKEILTNKDVISINQDALGIQGKLVSNDSDIFIYTKPILPIVEENHSYAICVLSLRTDGTPKKVEIDFEAIGLTNQNGYLLLNVFGSKTESEKYFKSSAKISVRVVPTGVVLLKAIAI